MINPSNGIGPSGKKVIKVAKNSSGVPTISNNVLTLEENHVFHSGESVRLYSDTGIVPGGLENEKLYYVINESANTIKLASSLNNALANSPVPIIITNTNGGFLTLISRVSDKIPGDLGHPVQFDTTENQWYITGTNTSENTIFSGFAGIATDVNANNASNIFVEFQTIAISVIEFINYVMLFPMTSQIRMQKHLRKTLSYRNQKQLDGIKTC